MKIKEDLRILLNISKWDNNFDLLYFYKTLIYIFFIAKLSIRLKDKGNEALVANP